MCTFQGARPHINEVIYTFVIYVIKIYGRNKIMSEERESTFSRIFYGLFPLVIVIILSYFIGLIFILATRLFTKLSKPPTARESICVGWALLWITVFYFLMPLGPENKPKPKDSIFVSGYAYEIQDNIIKFVHPPTGEIKVWWSPSKVKKYDDLYIHGKKDGQNRTFYISTSPNKIVKDDFGEGSGQYVGISVDGKNPGRKPCPDNHYKICSTIMTIIFAGLGVSSWYTAQKRAYDTTS